MAETNVTTTLDGAEQAQPSEASSENLVAPDTPDIPAPTGLDMTDGEIVAPSNVIVDSFGEKRAAAVDTEKQTVGQDKAAQEIPAAGEETPAKIERGGRPPKADKTVKEAKAEKSKTAERAPRLPNGPKEDKQAAGGGISGQSAGKEEAPPVPAEPEPPVPPRDATRPGETETIQYINHAELFPFKNGYMITRKAAT